MRVLNLYYSLTGNTEKVAVTIKKTAEQQGYDVDTIRISDGDEDLDILKYDFVFVGSGVYAQLPGKAFMNLHRELIQKYNKSGDIKPGAARRPSARTVVYCTYGGVHTGVNEAIPAVKYMGQLFDHLGYTIVAEWYIVGEYKTENLRGYSVGGRLGDIRGRPSEEDLKDVAERVVGVLQM